MLDLVSVFSKSGAVLWQCSWATLKGDPVNSAIHQVLLEDRAGALDQWQDANYTVKWSVDNEMDIVAVAVYQRVLVLGYVDELLTRVINAFKKELQQVAPEARQDMYPHEIFSPVFAKMHGALEQRALDERKTKAVKVPRAFNESKKFANTKAGNKQSCAVGGGDKPSSAASEVEKATGGDAATADDDEISVGGGDSPTKDSQIAANIAKLKAGGGGPPGRKKSFKGGKEEDEAPGASPGGKKGKEARKWDGTDDGTPKNLDFSKKLQPGESRTKVFKGGAVDLNEQFGVGAEEEDYDDDDDGTAGNGGGSPSKGGNGGNSSKSGGMFSALKGLVGGKEIEKKDLDGVMEVLHTRLTEKNVAQDIGGQICESVCASLLGKSLGSFGSLRTTVRTAMEATLTRILTPHTRVDLLAACEHARAEKRPFTIVFVGVNGVGKSTSLSKVAYYLKTNGFTPMLCACDTFRAGAVEQLRVHAQSLELPLFEKGYGRDASGIAADGIKYATQMGYDVVMVDTAGRMQDNEPLMRSLSKLVTLNNPDVRGLPPASLPLPPAPLPLLPASLPLPRPAPRCRAPTCPLAAAASRVPSLPRPRLSPRHARGRSRRRDRAHRIALSSSSSLARRSSATRPSTKCVASTWRSPSTRRPDSRGSSTVSCSPSLTPSPTRWARRSRSCTQRASLSSLSGLDRRTPISAISMSTTASRRCSSRSDAGVHGPPSVRAGQGFASTSSWLHSQAYRTRPLASQDQPSHRARSDTAPLASRVLMAAPFALSCIWVSLDQTRGPTAASPRCDARRPRRGVTCVRRAYTRGVNPKFNEIPRSR